MAWPWEAKDFDMNLPKLGEDCEGGIFAGITTDKEGAHYAVALLPAKSKKRLPWEEARAWAKKQGGELPTRPVAALLFANLKDKLQPTWHWTSEEDDAFCAWGCDFYGGLQTGLRKSYEGSVVAIRRIMLGANHG